jgi:serine/threonine protein kinase
MGSKQYVKVPDSDDSLPLPEASDGSTMDRAQSDPRFTWVKSEATKRYLTEQWQQMFHQRAERTARANSFKERLRSSRLSEKERKKERELFSKNERTMTRLSRVKPSPNDFTRIQMIGRGASGVIWLVRDKIDSNLYAMKVVNKLNIIVNVQADSVKSERNLLSTIDNPWVVKLFFSFQDPENLYLVLEFVQGGDLFSFLSRASILDEQTARFYLAEIALAVHSVHEFGFVHRDLKPDNILVTPQGHIKLADFGLSTSYKKRDVAFREMLVELRAILMGESQIPPSESHGSSERPCSMVGTVEYVAPEVLREEEYDARCDWWSLGVIAYEMLYGVTPFASPSRTETALKIVKYDTTLNFPSVPRLSSEAVDLLKDLLTDAPGRLSFQGIQAHPFFAGVDWAHLERMEVPFIPDLQSPEDLSAFEQVQPTSPTSMLSVSDLSVAKAPQMTKYAFLGFTYKRPRKPVLAVDVNFDPPTTSCG